MSENRMIVLWFYVTLMVDIDHSLILALVGVLYEFTRASVNLRDLLFKLIIDKFNKVFVKFYNSLQLCFLIDRLEWSHV